MTNRNAVAIELPPNTRLETCFFPNAKLGISPKRSWLVCEFCGHMKPLNRRFGMTESGEWMRVHQKSPQCRADFKSWELRDRGFRQVAQTAVVRMAVEQFNVPHQYAETAVIPAHDRKRRVRAGATAIERDYVLDTRLWVEATFAELLEFTQGIGRKTRLEILGFLREDQEFVDAVFALSIMIKADVRVTRKSLIREFILAQYRLRKKNKTRGQET